jgi:hypothetical protein
MILNFIHNSESSCIGQFLNNRIVRWLSTELVGKHNEKVMLRGHNLWWQQWKHDLNCGSKGAFTLGVKDFSIKSPNTKLVI